MAQDTSRWSDERVEATIGNLLRWGVTLAGTVVLAGAVVYLVRHGYQFPNYHMFRGEPTDLKTVAGIWQLALTGHGRGLIQLGLLLLVLTPIARVAFSLVAFVKQHDRLYVVVTLVVLGVLLYGILGKAG